MRAALPTRLRDLWPQFDWSYHLLLVLLIGAEAAVLTLVLTSGSTEVFPGGVVPGWLFVLLLLGTVVQQWMVAYRFFSPQYEVFSVLSMLALLFVGVRLLVFPQRSFSDLHWLGDGLHALAFPADPLALAMWASLVVVIYAWWRGRTRDEPSIDAAYRTLRFGTPVVALAVVVLTMSGATEHTSAVRQILYNATAAFFLLTLTAIALGRLRVEQARGTLTLTPRWLMTFLGPVLALVVLGALVAAIFTRRFLETLLWLLTPVFWLADLLLLLFTYVATALAWVVFMILTFLINLIGPVEQKQQVTPQVAGTPTIDPLAQVQPVQYPDSLRYLMVFVVLAAVIFLLTRFIWRRRPRRPLASGEVRESVFEWRLLAEGAAGLLSGLTDRWGRRNDPLAALRGDPRWQHTVAIREHYQQLLTRGERAKLPRHEGQTPDEYRPVVSQTATTPPVHDLTALYDAARYSDEPATAAQAAAAEVAWKEISTTIRTPKAE